MARLLSSDVTFDRIFKWVMDPDSAEITPECKAIYDRLDFCDNQLRRYARMKDVESIMRVKYPNISLVQIKRDIATTKRLFASITTINKDYEKLLLIEDIKDTMLSAKLKGDESSRTKAQKNLYLVLGIDKDDDLDISKLEKHTYMLFVGTKDYQFNMDLMDLQNIPLTARKRISDLMESEITEAEAYQILTPDKTINEQ